MKKLILFILPIVLLFGCTKDVQIDIPGFEEQLVIDGRIETGQPPIVFLSTSKEVYAPTDIEAFLNGFVTGAIITVSDGTTTVQLDEFCSDNLSQTELELAAAVTGIPASQLANYSICGYLTTNPAIFGQVGKTYTLTVTYDGQIYTAQTTILQPTSLDNTFWQPESGLTDHGFSWATLSDPAGQFDAYHWAVRRLDGANSDSGFEPTYSPVFDDEFFDGLSFDFWYENPYGDENPDSTRWMYSLGDTVVIKLSKLDRDVYEYMEKKMMQLQTAGNPFATPTNIPNNITGGALGIWAGYSSSYDTLICLP